MLTLYLILDTVALFTDLLSFFAIHNKINNKYSNNIA